MCYSLLIMMAGKEVAEHLFRCAVGYTEDEEYRFQCEIGWEDWMADVAGMEDPEEDLDETHCAKINEVLHYAFELAHRKPIETARDIAGLTLDEAAELLNITWGKLYDWESEDGEAEPDDETFTRIIDKLLDYKAEERSKK